MAIEYKLPFTGQQIEAKLIKIDECLTKDDVAEIPTPSIGNNGNWYIGDEDTGINAKGEDGKDGTDGEDGRTPVKGEDYFTNEDVANIINAVIEALSTAEGGSF